jgi:hypothetical protein
MFTWIIFRIFPICITVQRGLTYFGNRTGIATALGHKSIPK